MNDLTKKQQDYFLIAAPMLCMWFENMRQQQAQTYPVINKFLPGSSEKKQETRLNFSLWDIPQKNCVPIIEEYRWGVRCGLGQYFDPNNSSFASVLEIARTDEMAEIYSPVKIQYFSDGSRRVIQHQVSAYNTHANFGCYNLIDLQQAKDLFPQGREAFELLPLETRFLCSPDATRIRIANQEKGELGFDFNSVNIKKENAFFMGNLRETFEYIASEAYAGRGDVFCQPDKLINLDYLYNQIIVMCGAKLPYAKATEAVSEECSDNLREDYIKLGLKGKREFTILIDGSYIANDAGFNEFIAEDGGYGEHKTIKICVSPSIYQSWGRPFTSTELKLMYSPRRFDFDSTTEKDFLCKFNKLRFTEREIRIYRTYKKSPVIEVEIMQEVLEAREIDAVKTLEKNSIEADEQAARERERVRARYAYGDLSGPSRSSIYTKN